MWGIYFCMGAYKHDVVVVIHGCLFTMGAYYLNFMIAVQGVAAAILESGHQWRDTTSQQLATICTIALS